MILHADRECRTHTADFVDVLAVVGVEAPPWRPLGKSAALGPDERIRDHLSSGYVQAVNLLRGVVVPRRCDYADGKARSISEFPISLSDS